MLILFVKYSIKIKNINNIGKYIPIILVDVAKAENKQNKIRCLFLIFLKYFNKKYRDKVNKDKNKISLLL